jgi:multiple sugar transport system permease protein
LTQKSKDYFWAYVFILPTLVGLMVFNIGPLLYSFYVSFLDWGGFGQYEWGGWMNYERLVHDPDFWRALKNTILFTVVAVPFKIGFSLLVAVLLNQQIRGVAIYRTLYFLPVVTMPTAVGLVWKWLYNADYGLINYFLSFVGIQGQAWLVNPDLALYSVIAVAVWTAIGTNMIIILAGLQGISSSYYEAADIDGANALSKFLRITVPLLTPTLFFVTIVAVMGTLQTFELIFIMIGPQSFLIDETQTLVYFFFSEAFVKNDKGYGAAVALVLFVLILFITMIQMKLQKKWVHYE